MKDETSDEKWARRDTEASAELNVTSSCGCVFCDLKLEPELVDGAWVHRSEKYPDEQCAVRNERVG